MGIEVYTFEDAEGTEGREWQYTTQDAAEAKSYAIAHSLKVTARIFEYSDSELVWDFTKTKD